MDISEILTQIDAQISALQAAREAIRTVGDPTVATKSPGRPKTLAADGTMKRGPGRPPKAVTVKPAKVKRVMTPEGRAAIAAAQLKRWSEKRRADKKAAKAVAA